MSEFQEQEASTAIFSTASFKKKIIARLVASVRYYLSVSDIEKAETGLISILRIVGYLSNETIGVIGFFCFGIFKILVVILVFENYIPF